MFNKFDKIKISLDYDNNKREVNLFNKTFDPDLNQLFFETYHNRGLGLKIKINHLKRRISIEFSSKVLGARCIDLISIFDIRLVHNTINRIIEIPFTDFLIANTNYCEFVSEIKEEEYWKYIEALHEVSRLQTRFKYPNKPNKRYKKSSSFWLKKDQISRVNPEYISIYNKYNELTDKSKVENIEFFNYLTEEEATKVLNHYKDVIRIENKCQNKKNLKHQTGLGDCNLFNVLTINENIVLKKMNDIYIDILDSREKIEKLNYREYIKLQALKSHDYDYDKFYEELKLHGCNREKCKVTKEYRDIFSKSLRFEKCKTIKLIKELIEKMKW